MKINSYKDLIVWQKSIMMIELLYQLTAEFPRDEVFGLTSQMRRAAISIPSNIAEGYGRKTEKDYKRFYRMSYGSALELETQLVIARKLYYKNEEIHVRIESLLEEICKMLNVMSREKVQNN